MNCPQCGYAGITVSMEDDVILWGDGVDEPVIHIPVRVPVLQCGLRECGFAWTDDMAEDIKEKAVREHVLAHEIVYHLRRPWRMPGEGPVMHCGRTYYLTGKEAILRVNKDGTVSFHDGDTYEPIPSSFLHWECVRRYADTGQTIMAHFTALLKDANYVETNSADAM